MAKNGNIPSSDDLSKSVSLLKSEITRCRRKLTLLKKRGQEESEGYAYWLDRLARATQERFEIEIEQIESDYGTVTLEKRIIASGALQVTIYADGRYIKHLDQSIIPQHILDIIPITKDFRTNNPPCAVCRGLGTELHHWAPKHLFEDAHLWPTSYLCKKHHDEWHKKILEHWRQNNGVDAKSSPVLS